MSSGEFQHVSGLCNGYVQIRIGRRCVNHERELAFRELEIANVASQHIERRVGRQSWVRFGITIRIPRKNRYGDAQIEPVAGMEKALNQPGPDKASSTGDEYAALL